MILHDLPPGTTLFRAPTLQWASRPTSGAGAASRGGRFNREGIEALYRSLDERTALREYQQTSPFLPPCTRCSYTVSLRGRVDLRQLHRWEPWDALWHDWREDWRHLRFELHIEPPTWVLGDMVLAHGDTGILCPSQAHAGGTNVVVYVSPLKDGNAVGPIPATSSTLTGACPTMNPVGRADRAPLLVKGGLAETTQHDEPGCLAMAMQGSAHETEKIVR